MTSVDRSVKTVDSFHSLRNVMADPFIKSCQLGKLGSATSLQDPLPGWHRNRLINQLPWLRSTKALKEETSMEPEPLELVSEQLRWLWSRKTFHRSNSDSVLEARTVLKNKHLWCTLCQLARKGKEVWETYALTNLRVYRSMGRLQLFWYRLGMTAVVRKIVSSCEVSQSAAGNWKRFWAGSL